MNPADTTWLENRIQAAVDDDFYLDREEEKRIKEEGAARGIGVKDIELSVRTELEKYGAVCERLLLDQLERLLHQFTDNDRKLDNKEEQDALEKVVRPAAGKKKGLDPRVAEEYVSSFCKSHGVVRTTERNKRLMPVIVISLVLVAGAVVAGFVLRKDPERIVETKLVEKVVEKTVVETKLVDQAPIRITDGEKAEVDDLLRRAAQSIEIAEYTDPPERCAKASLDRIRQIDSRGQHRGAEVKALLEKIVDHYLDLAAKSFAVKDTPGTAKWLDRAKLMNASMELIRDKEREFGIIRKEQ